MDNKGVITREKAREFDAQDEFQQYREEFFLQPGQIYMDGNSLGLMSKRAEGKVLELMDSWRTLAIQGWTKGTHPWFYLPEKLSEMCAPLIGADSKEVMICGSTTSNIHQVISTFYKPDGNKTKIVADELTFPSDIYALQSQIKLQEYDPDEHLVRVKSRDGKMIEEEDIIAAMTDDVALVFLPTVLYRSGQLLDIERLTKEAHNRGIQIGFDACHSIGAVSHQFSDWGVDFAVWCNYKYLNGGPGSVAGLYVNKKHFGITPGLTGWYSSKKDTQFDMSHTLDVEESAGAFQVGTSHILSLAPLIASFELFAEADIKKIRTKSLHITRFMMELIDQELDGLGYSIGNPTDDDRRGGHICLEHDEAIRICKALVEEGIIPDNRPPNIIRLAPIAFYTSYEEVFDTVQILKKIVLEKRYEQYGKERNVVS
ncbi:MULTISPECIES: kynureninase [unclassified Sporosarcina]|uniref:kynureninase n=1 Tax=unclassified Sporosarcina TaxID=2647733 RepID=UPI00203A471F|nr:MULTISPECIES: kynureninase [unclassified Sporosarcina]GKV65235.1 kynureninase [Sporosarcina sp. NCCP-2331]GLB55359.1 kynureninase [Sporosarcina sp. NCCP-2378]